MIFTPRPYQADAIKAAVDFFRCKKDKKNGVLICPTASGKSVIIANIAAALPGKTVVFQPSAEILAQNFKKYISYGYRAGIYSASAGMKYIDTVTFATIGSVAKKKHLFAQFQNIIIDECHLVNPEEGMYRDFIKALGHAKVVGLTATPYRLASTSEGSMLKFLTRTSPRIFGQVLYYIQKQTLFQAGYLARLEYYAFNLVNREELQTNAAGTDFTDASVRAMYRRIDMPGKTADYTNRVLAKRKNCLVFCTLTDEARKVASRVPGAVVLTGDTPKAEREQMLRNFLKGIIRCIVNVGVLTTGFDFPGLEAVVIARSTMSLSLYEQMVGRAMRIDPANTGKVGWIIDLGGNVKFFGKIENMEIAFDQKGLFIVKNDGRQLTNVEFRKAA